MDIMRARRPSCRPARPELSRPQAVITTQLLLLPPPHGLPDVCLMGVLAKISSRLYQSVGCYRPAGSCGAPWQEGGSEPALRYTRARGRYVSNMHASGCRNRLLPDEIIHGCRLQSMRLTARWLRWLDLGLAFRSLIHRSPVCDRRQIQLTAQHSTLRQKRCVR